VRAGRRAVGERGARGQRAVGGAGGGVLDTKSRQACLDSGGPEPEGHQGFAGISTKYEHGSGLIFGRRAEEKGVPALSSGHCLSWILGHKIHEK
jgi:hypothetical protein